MCASGFDLMYQLDGTIGSGHGAARTRQEAGHLGRYGARRRRANSTGLICEALAKPRLFFHTSTTFALNFCPIGPQLLTKFCTFSRMHIRHLQRSTLYSSCLLVSARPRPSSLTLLSALCARTLLISPLRNFHSDKGPSLLASSVYRTFFTGKDGVSGGSLVHGPQLSSKFWLLAVPRNFRKNFRKSLG